ncbi:MAG: PA2779 family protein [Pseudomonadota bacterium]
MTGRQLLHIALASSVIWSTSLVGVAQASSALISTESAVEVEQSSALKNALNRSDVQAALIEKGISVAEAQARVNAMTQAQLAQLDKQLADMPAGANIVGAVVFVFLVLLITDILGVTDVFSFVKPIN